MAGDVDVRGLEQLESLARALKGAAGKPLRAQLRKHMTAAAKPTVKAARASALAKLPKRGGLAARVAGNPVGIVTKLGGRDVSIRFRAQGKRVRDLEGIDQGTVRHPVYGNRSVWVSQSVTPGWFTEPVQRAAPELRAAAGEAMEDVAQQIVRKV